MNTINDKINEKKNQKREPIYESKFSFTDANMSRVRKNPGKKVDRRFDSKIPGLCCVVKDQKINFYAWKRVPMFNRNKNTTETNVVYKKMFQWAKNTGFDCSAARDKVGEYLDKIHGTGSVAENIKLENIIREFIKNGMNGFKISDDTKTYKQKTIDQWSKLLQHYILLEGNVTKHIKDKMLAPVTYEQIIYTTPLKDLTVDELDLPHIQAFKWKMFNSKNTYNVIHAALSAVITWAIRVKIFKGSNPFLSIKKYHIERMKQKLPDDKRDAIKDYCSSKAFDYNPHFLTLAAIPLYTGCRGAEFYGLDWEKAKTQDELSKCSGWLEPGWDDLNIKSYISLYDTKNRKPFRVFLRTPLKKLFIRLRKKLYEDPNYAWCLKSRYVFPKTRYNDNFPNEHTDRNMLHYPLLELNRRFGLIVQNAAGNDVGLYNMRMGRRTFGSQVAAEKGVEVASRALNHSSPTVTRKHYIVPDDQDLEFELPDTNSNVENIEHHRIEKLNKLK